MERGAQLRELREACGLLQRQVGAAFDIDKAAVSEWENGKSNPDRRKLVKLDEMYGGTGAVLRLYEVAPMSNGEDLAKRLDELAEVVRRLQETFEAALQTGIANQQVIRERLDRLEQRGGQDAGGRPAP